jgi:hypothetical protein
MKRILVVIALLAQVAVRGQIMNVDFTLASTTDITVQNNAPGWTGYPLSGIVFSYDNPGYPGVPDTAIISTTGVAGGTVGTLIFEFKTGSVSTPVTALNVGFSLAGVNPLIAQGDPVTDGLFVIFYNSGAQTDNVTVPATVGLGNTATGSLAYTGAAFDKATLYYSLDATTFGDSSVSYQLAPVPEPSLGTIVCGLGLCSFAGWRFLRRQHA